MNVKRIFTLHKRLTIRQLLYYLGVILVGFGILWMQRPADKDAHFKTEIALRTVVDQLLRNVADFQNPVPPVEWIRKNQLSIALRHPIEINPDSLVDLSIQFLNADIARRSILRVLDQRTEKMVYGFELDTRKQNDIPCLGRNLPKALYQIDLTCYGQSSLGATNHFAFLGLLSGIILILAGIFWRVLAHPKKYGVQTIEWNRLKLMLDSNKLHTAQNIIQLTEKEAQILAVLFKNVGNLVSREDLVQEVWLKNGVITSRSLDMYISRLRKKMSIIPNVEIVNQYGKGYFLKKQ